jgi:glycerophosphoryl diester phosphodiesterase
VGRRDPLPLVSSFSEAALAAARAAVPNYRSVCCMNARRRTGCARLRQLAAVTLHCDADSLNDDLLREARAAGIRCSATRSMIQLLASVLYRRGVAAVFSDRIDCVAGD